jgi:hypothetical protein
MEALKPVRKDKRQSKIAVNSDAKDYGNEPFFIKKRERAKEVIDKFGIPDGFLKKESK